MKKKVAKKKYLLKGKKKEFILHDVASSHRVLGSIRALKSRGYYVRTQWDTYGEYAKIWKHKR